MIHLRTHELRPYHVALCGHLQVQGKREEGRDFISGKTLQGVMSRFVSFFKHSPQNHKLKKLLSIRATSEAGRRFRCHTAFGLDY